MLFQGQMLVVKENDLMVEQCLADLANLLVGERPREIEATALVAAGCSDSARLEAERPQHRAEWATARRSGVVLEITREKITSWDHSKLGDR